MSDQCVSEVTTAISRIKMKEAASPSNQCDNRDMRREQQGFDDIEYSTTSYDSNVTVTQDPIVVRNPLNIISASLINNIQIPIVGYEVMEERARFTVYKLRIENKVSGDCWYVFRRYTDFVRLCSRLKSNYPNVAFLLPRKRWFKDNFDPIFLEERIKGLQNFVNAILKVPDLVANSQIQDFFCLNEPPQYSDTTEESRAIFEALEETIYHLRHQLKEKDHTIDQLQRALAVTNREKDIFDRYLSSSERCQKCSKDYGNLKAQLSQSSGMAQSNEENSPGSSNSNS